MANSDKNIRITTSKNKATFPNIVFTGSAAGSSVITLEVLDDNTLSFSSNEGQVFSLDSNLSTGTIWSVNDISGVPLLRASAGATVGLAEYSGGVGIGLTNPSTGVYKLAVRGQVAFGSTADNNNHFIFDTSSTSVNTNSFQLRRGALAQFFEDGDAFKTTFRANAAQAADANYIWPVSLPTAAGSSVLQSDTSGNLTWVPLAAGSGSAGAGSGTVAVPGAQYQVAAYYSGTGASVSGSTTFTNNTATGVVDINHTTESTSITSGALVVDGGAGIAKSLFVGTTLSVGSAPGYNAPNNLASFVSTVNSYNQLVIQNRSNGTSASANLVVNNDVSSDAANYGEIGMNSSTFSGSGALNAPNAVYVAAHTSPLVLGTVTAHPIRFAVNSGATDLLYFAESGAAISCFTNLDLRSQNDIRFFNSGNTFNTALQAGANSASYTLSLPTAPVGAGYSTILVDTAGNMFFAPLEGGLSTTSVTGNRVVLRSRMEHHVWMAAGYTPLAAGADNIIYLVPDSSEDGATKTTFELKEFTIRVETPSAGSSRIQLERSSTDTGAFTLAATGSSLIGGFGLTIAGAGIYVTSTNTFAAGTLVTSGNLLRLNFNLLNATHANFSVQFTLNEV
jgi:hypothetical protein